MGLMDVFTGMMNGPRGPRDPSADKGGMSPITMAILGLLAYKGYKHFSGSGRDDERRPDPGPGDRWGGERDARERSGGGLGGGLGGILGGLFGGGAGGALSGGLKDLVDQFHQKGRGDVADSWVGRGENRGISERELADVLGPQRIDELAARTGMSRDELLADLSRRLPGAVDRATPHGRLPNEREARRWL